MFENRGCSSMHSSAWRPEGIFPSTKTFLSRIGSSSLWTLHTMSSKRRKMQVFLVLLSTAVIRCSLDFSTETLLSGKPLWSSNRLFFWHSSASSSYSRLYSRISSGPPMPWAPHALSKFVPDCDNNMARQKRLPQHPARSPALPLLACFLFVTLLSHSPLGV